jgi:hypothetical protein
MTAHGYETGLKGQTSVKSGGGTLPTGITTSTDYFVIAVDANTIKLAASLANALAGTEINMTNQGTTANVFTFTPTAVAGGVIHAEGSVDGVNWQDVYTAVVSSSSTLAATATVTATGGAMWNLPSIGYRKLRVHFTCTAGQVAITGQVSAKNEE